VRIIRVHLVRPHCAHFQYSESTACAGQGKRGVCTATEHCCGACRLDSDLQPPHTRPQSIRLTPRGARCGRAQPVTQSNLALPHTCTARAHCRSLSMQRSSRAPRRAGCAPWRSASCRSCSTTGCCRRRRASARCWRCTRCRPLLQQSIAAALRRRQTALACMCRTQQPGTPQHISMPAAATSSPEACLSQCNCPLTSGHKLSPRAGQGTAHNQSRDMCRHPAPRVSIDDDNMSNPTASRAPQVAGAKSLDDEAVKLKLLQTCLTVLQLPDAVDDPAEARQARAAALVSTRLLCRLVCRSTGAGALQHQGHSSSPGCCFRRGRGHS
jgi:hypothetical protein